MMEMPKTYEDVYNWMEDILKFRFPRIPESSFKPNASFRDDLMLDSLDMVDFLCEVESKCGFELVNNDDVETINKWKKAASGTMKDMAQFLYDCMKEKE